MTEETKEEAVYFLVKIPRERMPDTIPEDAIIPTYKTLIEDALEAQEMFEIDVTPYDYLGVVKKVLDLYVSWIDVKSAFKEQSKGIERAGKVLDDILPIIQEIKKKLKEQGYDTS